MAGKDITEKALEAFNDVFSDIVNVLLFDGEEYVKEAELEQGRERGYYVGDKPVREQERDSSKYWRQNTIRIAYFGLENETEAEDDVPFRVIGYDGAAYRDQIGYSVDAGGKRHKTVARYPVITLVLHMDYRKRWDKPKSLHEALEAKGKKIDEKLAPFVQDYGVNVFDIAFLPDETAAKFRSDFRILVDYLVQMRKNGNYVPDERKIDHVRETLNLMSFVTDDSRFRESLEGMQKGDEPKNMCAVLDRIENKGRMEGRQEGRIEGRQEGIRIGQEKGIQIGQEKGIQIGQNETKGLMAALVSAGRSEDVVRASTDADFFDQILREYREGRLKNGAGA